MELVAGGGILGALRAFGPCLPPASQLKGKLIEIKGSRKNLSGQCTLNLTTYSSVDDCSGQPDGSIAAAPLTNPEGWNKWLPYRVRFVLDEPDIRSLRPVAGVSGDLSDVCLVDSISVTTATLTQVPIDPRLRSVFVLVVPSDLGRGGHVHSDLESRKGRQGIRQ